jgi:hydrogenase maturation protease
LTVISSFRQLERASGAEGARARLRVVGLGNPFAGDDSVGLEIVRRLRATAAPPCELMEMPQAGIELMEVFEGAETVLFIDAVSSGALPGTLHLVPLPSPVVEARALGMLSAHGWSFGEALGLMAALGRRVPRAMLLGIEIESTGPGASRGAAVEAAAKLIVDGFPALRATLCEAENNAWRNPQRFAPGGSLFPGSRGKTCSADGGL